MELSNNEKSAMRYYIRTQATYASCLEMLSEECSEAGHAALKLARYRRGEQPLAEDFNSYKAEENLIEEVADVMVASYVAGLMDGDNERKIRDIFDEKLNRWYLRMKKRNDPESFVGEVN